MIENENTKQNEVKDNVPYKFTASPLNLLYVLDSDCFKMLNLLIQEQSYWKSEGELVNGYFFKSLNALKEDMFMSNDQDVRLTLETLYINKLIDIIPQGEQHKASKIRINLEKIMEINKRSITEVKKFVPRICKLRRGSKCSYADKKGVNSITPEATILSTNCTSDCTQHSTPKLYNIDKSNNIDKIDNNIIVDNIIAEAPKEKDRNSPQFTSKGIIDDSNGNASATKMTTQATEQTKSNITNGDKLVLKLNQDFNELDREDFYKTLYTYSTAELKEIRKRIPTLKIGLSSNDKDNMKYYTTIAIRRKEAS